MMKNLKPGDRVLALSDDSRLVYSDVIMFLHRETSTLADYYTINTKETSLHVSSHHLVMVANNATGHHTYKYAKDVTVNDKLLVAMGNNKVPLLSEVTGVSVSEEEGLYAPLTTEGRLVVDDVVVSCYASIWSHDLAHFGFAPLRAIHYLLGFEWSSLVIETQPEGIHGYPQILMNYREPLMAMFASYFQ